jgi:hypothetical protein
MIKGTVSRDFLLQVSFMNHLPQATENNIRVISKLICGDIRKSTTPGANLPPVSTTPVANFATSTVGKFCHQYRWQILPPVPLVLLILVAILPLVSTKLVVYCHTYQQNQRQIC